MSTALFAPLGGLLLLFALMVSEHAAAQSLNPSQELGFRASLISQFRTCDQDDPIFIDVGHSLANPGPSDPFKRSEFQHNKLFVEPLIFETQKLALGRTVIPIGLDGQAVELSAHVPSNTSFPPHKGVFLSVHHDMIDQTVANQRLLFSKPTGEVTSGEGHPTIRGWTIYVSRRTGANALSIHAGQQLGATLLLSRLPDSRASTSYVRDEQRIPIDLERNVYFFDDLYVLRHQARPSVLLEIGFLNAPQDVKNLYDHSFRVTAIRAVAKAVVSFPCAKAGLTPQPDTDKSWNGLAVPPLPKPRSY